MTGKNKARVYKPSTIRRLDTLSGNLCSKPGCPKPLIGEDGKTIISKICHIEGASPKGPRYNANMTDDDRRDYSNLILLCDEHHEIVDNKENENEYPVELLKEWKSSHEKNTIQKKIEENPSLLGEAINAISKIDTEEVDRLPDSKAFKIQQKIEYNNVVKYRPIINAYKIYYGKIDKIYTEMDKQGSDKKGKLLRNIERIYFKVKGKYIEGDGNEIDYIRKNADKIIEDVEEEILSKINNKTKKEHYEEDIDFAVILIMVDAFMRCKILEKPNL